MKKNLHINPPKEGSLIMLNHMLNYYDDEVAIYLIASRKEQDICARNVPVIYLKHIKDSNFYKVLHKNIAYYVCSENYTQVYYSDL